MWPHRFSKRRKINEVYLVNDGVDNNNKGHILIRKAYLSLRFRWAKMYELNGEYWVDTRTKQNIYGYKKIVFCIESYFSENMFHRDINMFAKCTQ